MRTFPREVVLGSCCADVLNACEDVTDTVSASSYSMVSALVARHPEAPRAPQPCRRCGPGVNKDGNLGKQMKSNAPPRAREEGVPALSRAFSPYGRVAFTVDTPTVSCVAAGNRAAMVHLPAGRTPLGTNR